MRALLGFIVLILDILAIIEIIRSKAKDTEKILWVLLIIFLPFVGLLLWWFLARKK